jgi:hypothetical protein
MLRGANEIVDHVKSSIGVKRSDEVSADGLFSFEEVECLGACEFAPMMRFDHEYHYELTPAKIDALIADRRTGDRSPSPPRGEGRREGPKTPSQPAVVPALPDKATQSVKAERRRTPRKKKSDA